MTIKLIEQLEAEALRAERRAQQLRNAIAALNGNEPLPLPSDRQVAEQRLKSLEKARAVRWGNNKFSGRKAKMDKALHSIFVQQGSRFTINQTMQVLTNKHGITQKAYKDRRSFNCCVRHGLMSLVQKGVVRYIAPAETGTRESIWETIQPSLPVVQPHETHEVSEL